MLRGVNFDAFFLVKLYQGDPVFGEERVQDVDDFSLYHPIVEFKERA